MGPIERETEPGSVHDRQWAGEVRAAAFCALALFAVLLLVDAGNGTLGLPRALCWTGVALVLFAILVPPRVTAGHHWLAVRGLLGEHKVHTDLLTLVRRADGVAPRLVLRDALGNRVEIDPGVLSNNPALWHLLDCGARQALRHGLLSSGFGTLRTLADCIDGGEALAVFKVSGLD